jgi:hypothetical protein
MRIFHFYNHVRNSLRVKYVSLIHVLPYSVSDSYDNSGKYMSEISNVFKINKTK